MKPHRLKIMMPRLPEIDKYLWDLHNFSPGYLLPVVYHENRIHSILLTVFD